MWETADDAGARSADPWSMSTLLTIAQYHMDYGDHMHRGWGWGMAVLMVLLLAAVVVLVVWVVRTTSHRAVPASPAGPTAREILERRLAEGDITPDEYRERTGLLG